MEFLTNYGLFLAETVTIVLAIVAIIIIIASVASKPKSSLVEVEIEDISGHVSEIKEQFEQQLLSKKELKQRQKERKKQQQEKDKDEAKPHLFVVNFNGGTDAEEVNALRQEITAILTVAGEQDQVLIKVESPGGVVHGYGLAAAQIMRLKQQGIGVTVAVDKVAASGGYLMACVADKIIAAPFAIIGSIGVMAQLPNFNRLLKKHDIDYELFTAGEYKRTVTMFGQNTDKAREKFNQELESVHLLFKDFVTRHRASLDIDSVATGEHWYGSDALKRGLIDQLQTSDDHQMEMMDSHKVIGIKCTIKRGMAEKLGIAASVAIDSTWTKWINRTRDSQI